MEHCCMERYIKLHHDVYDSGMYVHHSWCYAFCQQDMLPPAEGHKQQQL